MGRDGGAFLGPKNARHCKPAQGLGERRSTHMRAQQASKEQQRDMASNSYKQLEGRLDEMLSRIAKETEEIRDLEQQLTDGQIAANDALKKDLEAIIAGLQEYLESVKGQAKIASEECRELQKDKEALLQRLEELEKGKKQLEIVAVDAENLQKEIAQLESALQEERGLNAALQEAQGDLSAYEAELEARDVETGKLVEELERLKHRSQLEYSALQAELHQEREALENALTKAELLEEQEEENHRLLSQLKQLKKDNGVLKQQLKETQRELKHAADGLIHPEDVLARVNELTQKLQAGADLRPHDPNDVLGGSLADLHRRFAEILARSQQENEAAQAREREVRKAMASQKAKLEEAHDKYKLACHRAADAKIKSEKRQNETKVRQLENEIRHLNGKLKSMEEIQGLSDQQLQEAEEEKEKILAQLQELEKKRNTEDAKAQTQFLGLGKELKALKKAISASDQEAAAELWAAKDQLRALHGTVCRINQERTEELQELERFCLEATQASKDLSQAEAEIELLQQLLKEKEEQHETEKSKAKMAASHSQKEETDKLKQLLKSQRADVDRLRGLLDQAGAGCREEIGGILDEIEGLKQAVARQNEAIAGILDPLRPRGRLFFMPSPSQASTPASRSTKDSGLGLRCPTSTPVNKEEVEGRPSPKEDPASSPTRGAHLHPPVRSGPQESPSHGGSQETGQGPLQNTSSFLPPPGSVIYTLLPNGSPAPQGTVVYGPPPPSAASDGNPLAPTTVIYGPPPSGAQLVYAPLPANCSVPLVPVAVLHCNIPEHYDLENECVRLEDAIDKLKSRRCKGSCARASLRQQNDEMEELHQGIRDLLLEKEELVRQVTELRRIAQNRSQRKDFIDGPPNGLLPGRGFEKSLQLHGSIMDEVECVGKTLLKRRAELREADRLLAEAELELESTRGKTKDTIQKYNSAKRHLTQTAKEAEELERRAQEVAVRLVKAEQQLRALHADAKELERHKAEQEELLKDILKVISAKDSEFQSLSQKTEILNEILQKLQANIQVAEGNEDYHLQILKEAEHILQSKKSDLERLKDQTADRQQELLTLDRKFGQKEEELQRLHDSVAQKNASLAQALKDGEAEVAKKRQQIKDMKSFLEELSVEKGELGAQLGEKRAQLSLVTQEVHKEEEKLQDVRGAILKHKTELKRVLEMLHLESNEVEGVKHQRKEKAGELEKMQAAISEEKRVLENLRRATQEQHRDVGHQRDLLERNQKEAKELTSQLHVLQNHIQVLSAEKQQLEENCAGLEGKLCQTERSLASTEATHKSALASLEKMDLNARELQCDVEQLEKRKMSLNGDLGELQKHFQGKKEELNRLKTELSDSKHHLQLLEQEVQNARAQKENLLREEAALKDGIRESTRKCQECQQSQRTKEMRLGKLCREIEDWELERAKQEMVLRHLQEDTQHEGKKLDECMAKLGNQKQRLEQELAKQQRQLEETMANVRAAEERVRKLQEDESWRSALEETIDQTRRQLSEKERQLQGKGGEVLSLQGELERAKAKEALLRDRIQGERETAKQQIVSLKEAIRTQRGQLERALHTKNQEDLEKCQKEMKATAKRLKLEVKDKIRTGLKDLSQSPPEEPPEDMEAGFDADGQLQNTLESLKENYPFAENEARMPCLEEKLDRAKVHIMDEQWRGKAHREQLEHQEDRLKAQLQQRMSKQVEALIKGKQQTEGTLHSLRRQVDALDGLVSSTSSAGSPFLSLDSSGATDASLYKEPNRL